MLRSKSPTNKKKCPGKCGEKIFKNGEPTCGKKSCMDRFIADGAVKKAIKLSEKIRRKQEREAIKKERQQTTELRERVLTLNELMRSLQTKVNNYIRKRDKDTRCPTCNNQLQPKNFDAGHLIPRGKRGKATAVRFDLFNIHGQCKDCNKYGFSDHDYIKSLEERYGEGCTKPLFRYYDELEKQGFKPDREWLKIIEADLKRVKKTSG